MLFILTTDARLMACTEDIRIHKKVHLVRDSGERKKILVSKKILLKLLSLVKDCKLHKKLNAISDNIETKDLVMNN